MKEKIEEKLKYLQMQVTTTQIKDVFDYIEEEIFEEIERLEKEEPYATNTISRYKQALSVLSDIYQTIDDRCTKYDNPEE